MDHYQSLTFTESWQTQEWLWLIFNLTITRERNGNGQKCNQSGALIGDHQIIDKVQDKLSHRLFLSNLNSLENTVAGIYKFITVPKRQSNCLKKPPNANVKRKLFGGGNANTELPQFWLGKAAVRSVIAVSPAIFGPLFGHDIISPANHLNK